MAATSKPVRKVLKKMAHEKGREHAKEYKKDLKEYVSKGGKHNLYSEKASEKKHKQISSKIKQLNIQEGYDKETGEPKELSHKAEKTKHILRTKYPKSTTPHSKESMRKLAAKHMKMHGG